MPPKTLVIFDEEAREKAIKGLDTLNHTVSMTLGPRSRAVGMDMGFMWKINKDGVSVARSIHLEDPFEDFAVKVVTEAAQKTVDETGDGTTCTIILAHAIIHECLKVMSSGVNPMALLKTLEVGSARIMNALDDLATPIKSLEEKINIATISASGDHELGSLIGETLHKIGEQGVMIVEETRELETRVEIQEGMQLENGFSHPLFITDPERMSAVLTNCRILVSSKNLLGISEIAPFLEKISKQIKQLVIIAPDISVDVMDMLLQNKLKGIFLSLAIKAPGAGENQRDTLRDIAALTGARWISSEAGDKFTDLTLADLGKIDRIEATKSTTAITSHNGKKEAIEERVATINAQLKDETISDHDKEKLKERLGKLTNGIAVLKVGGVTEVEMKERKERALDALGATKAAIAQGIVPGGEMALLRARWVQEDNKILVNALRAPFDTLVTNAGYNPGEIYGKVEVAGKGFDVIDGRVKYMVGAGIIDPVAVPKSALRNAISVASQIITLGAIIVNKPEELKK